MKFEDDVADLSRVHRQIDGLASRAKGRRLELLVQDGVRFTQLLMERESVVRVIGRALADASYRPGVARVSRSFIAGKWRDVARLGPLDVIAHGVVAEILGERLEHHLSPRVYSYRAKRSPWQALRWLAKVARMDSARRPDPRTRGLYVLRSDIQRYAPTIPLDAESLLWPELRAICELDESSPHWEMVRSLVLQELVDAEGASCSRDRGVLFGAPTSNALMNMYLIPLDDAFDALRGAYARFGDDVLFAHFDLDVVKRAKRELDRVLVARRLEPNPDKVKIFYWNNAARPAPHAPEIEAVSRLAFLGGWVGFDGTISLPPAKWRAALRDLRARIRRTARLVPDATPEARARILAGVTNAAFDLGSDLSVSYKEMLIDLVSDRAQLAQLDYLLALWIAEAATGARGPAAFRRLGYRWLRRRAGLESRLVARNRRPP
ncbi:MAG: hypothetical protein KF819_15960 [Labilithrix sp.]|nr:hypothetical protein [Labilithrix sp.]